MTWFKRMIILLSYEFSLQTILILSAIYVEY